MKDCVNSIKGFHEPEEYHTSFPIAFGLNILLLIGLSEVFFPGVIAAFVSSIPFGKSEVIRFVSEHKWQVASFILFLIVQLTAHEAVHAFTQKLNGFDYSSGIQWIWLWKIPNPVPYVVVLDDPIPRRKNIAGLIAPLIALGIVGLAGLVPFAPAIVTYYAKVLLILNTSGSSADMYNSVKVWLYPTGTLFRNVKCKGGIRTFTYEPVDG